MDIIADIRGDLQPLGGGPIGEEAVFWRRSYRGGGYSLKKLLLRRRLTLGEVEIRDLNC